MPVERRADGDKFTLVGYAAVFGEVADIGGYFGEVIARGAFTETLKTADVRAYFDHDSGRILGRSSAGTLRLREDDKGLAVEIDLPDTSDGRDVRTLVERGDVSGMSFSFSAVKQTWDEATDPPTRTIQELKLYEVSVVSDPAYEGTSVALRSRDEARKDKREHNFRSASSRISARNAEAEQRFRNIK
ncbi:HK97 family phage prohead protease [Ochrobactrum tritici]|nr:HK97 family phage prohead protease [Brucella tritici]